MLFLAPVPTCMFAFFALLSFQQPFLAKLLSYIAVLKTQYRIDELEKNAVKVVGLDGWEDDAVISLREAAKRFNHRKDDVACSM